MHGKTCATRQGATRGRARSRSVGDLGDQAFDRPTRQPASKQGATFDGMRGDEARVVDAFCAWLVRDGWDVRREVEFVDVLADKDGQRLYAEAKGRTQSPGLDVDTLYGQLLRRMPPDEVGLAWFAVVVPSTAVGLAERVPASVRALLRIRVFGVDETGAVTEHAPTD